MVGGEGNEEKVTKLSAPFYLYAVKKYITIQNQTTVGGFVVLTAGRRTGNNTEYHANMIAQYRRLFSSLAL